MASARVTIRDVDRGGVREARTGMEGLYLVLPLEVGRYSVEVEHPDFARSVISGVELTLGRELRLGHVLELAPARESVTVTAEVNPVDAALAASSGRMRASEISELPLRGRDFFQLSLTQPGIHQARAQFQNGNNGFGLPLSIAGSRPGQNSLRLDGVHLTGQTGGISGSVNGLNLGADAIQEFVVSSSVYDADTGRAAGGVIHAVTRSGGNQGHGGLYYFHRNSALDARNFFDRDAPPPFRRHQFGGLLSGPIVRDRSFFFLNLERLTQQENRPAINTTLSDEARAGRLKTGTVAVDPAARRFIELLPLPNDAVLGDTGLFVFSNPETASERFFTGRVDWRIAPRQSIFLRYLRSGSESESLTNFAIARREQQTALHSVAAEHTSVLSPNSVNALRFGWARTRMNLGETRAVARETVEPALAFVPGAPGPGVVTVAGLSTFEGGTGAADADISRFDSHQLYEDFSLNRHKHLVKAGAYVEWMIFDFDSRSNPLGEFSFGTVADLLGNTPQRFRAMLPGTDSVRRFRQKLMAWYLEDSWRPTPRLTVNLGVRHEWISVPVEASGKLSRLDRLTDPAPVTGSALFRNPSLRSLAPRFGLAWDPQGRGRTVFRAAYGIFHDHILLHHLLLAGVRNPPYFLYADVRDLAEGAFPSAAYDTLRQRPRIDLRMERLDPRPGQPYVQHWTGAVVQALPAGVFLRAIYAGSHGVHLSRLVEDANLVPFQLLPDGRPYFPENGRRINPAFGMIRNRLFDGHSFYQSLQTALTVQHRGGLYVQAALTWSKSIDDDSSTFARTDSANSIGIPVDGMPKFNRGLSNHDVRRHLSVAAAWQTRGNAAPSGASSWRSARIVSTSPSTVGSTFAGAAVGRLEIRRTGHGGIGTACFGDAGLRCRADGHLAAGLSRRSATRREP